MIRFLLIAMLFSFTALPVIAQEDADAVLAKQAAQEKTPEKTSIKEKIMDKVDTLKSKDDKDDEKERLELSNKMHEIWPIRQKIESALDNIAENLPQQERLKFKSTMRAAIDFDELKTLSVNTMADIYTKAELEKMVEFYGSKEGRSVSYKTGDYEKALRPVMIKMIDKALLDAKLGKPKAGAHSTPRR